MAMMLSPSPVAPVALATVLLAQGSFSPRQFLDLARPLELSEISSVLKGVYEALDGKTFRLSWHGSDSGTRVLMRAGGRARIIQMTYAVWHGVVGSVVAGAEAPRQSSTVWRDDITTILEYPGIPARRCDGSVARDEMVIEYTRRGSGGWTATARAQIPRDAMALVALVMVRSTEDLSSGERRQIDGKWARAIVAPWADPHDHSARVEKPALLIGDPLPNVLGEPFRGPPSDARQSLWIETETLLPLRWEVTKPEPTRVLIAGTFDYESFELRPPPGVDAPVCIR